MDIFLAVLLMTMSLQHTQEVVHSIEIDSSKPPRMIAKIDIAKSFDTIEWKAILVHATSKKYPFLIVVFPRFMLV